MIVTTEPPLFSSGPSAEPLIEPGDDPWRLLADAQGIVVERGRVATSSSPREGDPAEELVDMARSVDADRIVVGRRGPSFVAPALIGRSARRRTCRPRRLVVA